MLRFIAVGWAVSLSASGAFAGGVTVEIAEGLPDKKAWDFTGAKVAENYSEAFLGFAAVPAKYNKRGNVLDRAGPFALRADLRAGPAAGECRILLRSLNAARLFLDGKLICETKFISPNASGHEHVPDAPATKEPGLRPLPVGHQEKIVAVTFDGKPHEFRLEAVVGTQKLRHELGELCVAVSRAGESFQLLGETPGPALSDEGWTAYADAARARYRAADAARKRAAEADEVKYWAGRHALAKRQIADEAAPAVPEAPKGMPANNAVDQFIGKALADKGVAPASLPALTDDYAFLRRVTLDTVGVVPTPAELEAFLSDKSPDKRAKVIDRLLADARWADNWVGYWQDVLAENPGLLKPTLNNTGPFRWWIRSALAENMGMDRFASELIMMEGSKMGGGPAGFGMASQNDSPMASKAEIIAKAFLGVDLKCVRCHDAPSGSYKQKQLFSLAAMLAKAPQTVPATSSVPFREGARKPLVKVTLPPGSKVTPAWSLSKVAADEVSDDVLREPNNPRERLAAVLTSARNERFAQVVVNRLWKRYLGLGLVEPVDNWEDMVPSHPELLDYLGRELAANGFDLKHAARLILKSHVYQRSVRPAGSPGKADERLFASPARRRMSAEQLVDSLFASVAKPMNCEELNFDPECRRPVTEMLNLGTPKRAWEMAGLSNERDRPALALPATQGVVDVMTAFGWRDSRQTPETVRDETPTPLQPLILANGMVGARVTRLCDDNAVTALSLRVQPLPELVRAVFIQILTRPPTDAELRTYVSLLSEGYDKRVVAGAKPIRKVTRSNAVSWSNHLSPEATQIKLEQERAAREGDPATPRLTADWRERMEDMLWSLVNSPEFVFVP